MNSSLQEFTSLLVPRRSPINTEVFYSLKVRYCKFVYKVSTQIQYQVQDSADSPALYERAPLPLSGLLNHVHTNVHTVMKTSQLTIKRFESMIAVCA